MDSAPNTSRLPPAPAAEESGLPLPGQVRKIALLLGAVFVPLIGPMVAVALGVYRLDPGAPPVVRRDGRELVAVGLILFVLQLLLVSSVLNELRGGALGGGSFEIR